MVLSPEECRRVLGVPAGATPETIRQVYLDLVRVWHPDRFQSDARLRLVAEDNLRKINDAYAALKDAPAASQTPPPTNPEAKPRPAATPETPRSAEPPKPVSVRQPQPPPRRVRLTAMITGAAAVAFCLVPLAIHRNSTAAHPSETTVAAPIADVDTPVPDKKLSHLRPARKPEGADEPQAPLANGTDLIPPGRLTGVGDLRVGNRTDREAIVRMVSDAGAMVRVLYVVAGGSVDFRSVPIGVYSLHVELGRDLDRKALRFRSGPVTAPPLGPFQFLEITSDKGRTGSHFEVALKPR